MTKGLNRKFQVGCPKIMMRIRTFGGNFELHTCADSYHNFWTANLKIPIQRRGLATGATIEILFSIGGILAYMYL